MRPGETSLLAQKHVTEELSSEPEVSKQLLHLEELNAPETQKKNNLATLKTAQVRKIDSSLSLYPPFQS